MKELSQLIQKCQTSSPLSLPCSGVPGEGPTPMPPGPDAMGPPGPATEVRARVMGVSSDFRLGLVTRGCCERERDNTA